MFQTALNRLRVVRFRYLGFGFFWAVSFTLLSGFADIRSSSSYTLYSFAEQWFIAIVPFAGALVYRHRMCRLPRFCVPAAGGFLALSVFLFAAFAFFDIDSVLLPLVAALCVGIASGLFFLQWQVFYASAGQSLAAICIPASAVFSVIIHLLIGCISWVPALLAVLGVLLPVLAVWSLARSLSEVEYYEALPFRGAVVRKTFSELWKPVFCVAALGFIWHLISAVVNTTQDTPVFFSLGGFAVAALLIGLLELFFPRGFDILRIYQILFPVIAGVLLVATFMGGALNSALVGILMFGFEIMNLLLLMVVATYPSRNGLSPLLVYGICVVPTFVAMALGTLVGHALSPLAAKDFTYFIGVLFACVYVLSMVLLLIFHSRRPAASSAVSSETSAAAEGDAAGEGALDYDQRALALAEGYGISPREVEVMLLLIHGHSISSISRRLFISENTTRGHTKAIYRKLEVHSRQDLINLIDPVGE
jgi:DNA-binding CsgD family transcriptional regulator